MSQLSLEQARTIIANAANHGNGRSLKPLCIAVLDAGGHLIALERQDGASTLRPNIAIAKAAGALGLGTSSRNIGEIAQERPSFIGALAALAPLGVIPAAGGLIIVDDQDRPIGAVGITGDTSDNDEECALAGIAAAGLRPLR
ncbi:MULTISPECIES: GlcG/HbpS family heme-binding protein [unclassified Sphingomonas]|uniref:GlcG/HbpS family heme-binding protein n=1 Tax=unclassified Sphingomonas TaxID=196159 RepID=UPI0006F4263D|nr:MULTISPECIES: heme-binding protein [unclassified Sphingomonas]KQX23411.1 GlcG protein [Sphingomonas sp. Root1294]KQY68262.1 GlcG protein [Sphingomonas sp. Root50]KRB91160.1 GlcG protein [Sphingomonas sp. Root720]